MVRRATGVLVPQLHRDNNKGLLKNFAEIAISVWECITEPIEQACASWAQTMPEILDVSDHHVLPLMKRIKVLYVRLECNELLA
jgi:hypothetical protein